MYLNIKSFLKGYSSILELIPNFNINNQQNDWKNIGGDIFISINRKDNKKIEQTRKKRN